MLYLLDDELRVLAFVETYEKLVWHKRLQAAGSFEAVLHASFFPSASKASYLYRALTGEIALVEQIVREKNGSLTIKGRTAEALLGTRMVLFEELPIVTTAEAVYRMILVHCSYGNRIVPHLALGSMPAQSAPFVGGVAGENLLSCCLSLLSPNGMGLDTRLENNEIIVDIRAGTDLSKSVIFSDAFENLSGLEYRSNQSNGRNVAYVFFYDKNGNEQTFVVDRTKPGETRRECCVSARDIKWNYKNADGVLTERTEAEFEAILTRLGEKACRTQTLQLSAHVRPDGVYRYQTDYRVGDLISVHDSAADFGGIFRVLGAEEIFTAQNTSLKLELGETVS